MAAYRLCNVIMHLTQNRTPFPVPHPTQNRTPFPVMHLTQNRTPFPVLHLTQNRTPFPVMHLTKNRTPFPVMHLTQNRTPFSVMHLTQNRTPFPVLHLTHTVSVTNLTRLKSKLAKSGKRVGPGSSPTSPVYLPGNVASSRSLNVSPSCWKMIRCTIVVIQQMW